MSLFDVLKYGNTDLSNHLELEKLPSGLLDLYWNHTYGCVIVGLSIKEMCRLLADWHDSSMLRESQKRSFKRALEDYDEPI